MMMMICEDEEYMYSEGLASEQFGMSKKRKSMNKKRFNDEQIKSLETIFESESKLEPRKKLQVARELGLQPRQVAIWFQNKRARYKSKQLEQDYGVLRANYDNMASQFEELKKEKQALQVQLQKLNDQMKKSREENQLDGGDETNEEFKSTSTIVAEEKTDRKISIPFDDDGTVNGKNSELNEKLETSLCEHNIGVISDDDSSLKVEYFGLEEEPELLNLVGPADSTLTSPENWGSLESEGLMTQSGSSCQWWDVWP